jgi:hypothetical protein
MRGTGSAAICRIFGHCSCTLTAVQVVTIRINSQLTVVYSGALGALLRGHAVSRHLAVIDPSTIDSVHEECGRAAAGNGVTELHDNTHEGA